MRQTITKTKLVTGPNVSNNENNNLESLGDCGMMCAVEEVVFHGVILDAEVVVLDDVIWDAEVVLDNVIWDAGVVLDDVIWDDPSLQSLTIATLSSFTNRQSKLGLSLTLTTRSLGKD